MKRILRKSKSKGKGVAADASSVVSSEGVTSLQIGEYVIKEKDLPKVHKAAWTGDINKIRSHGNKRHDLNALDKENRTPLHLACYNGHIEVVKFLVASGAKLNVCDGDQRSPLMRAIQAGKFDIAEHLLRQNADPSLIDINGDSALHIAVYTGQQDAVRLLMSYGAMVDATNKQRSTPLHAATSLANVDILELLLEKDADVNVQDSANRTPLMLACQADQIGIVKMLLEHRADPSIKDQKGWTANDHAIMGGFHGCSHLIEERQTIKRAPSGNALSGSGLFGSTTNSTDALGFPLGGPDAPASDISGDNEDELSINKRTDDDDDSWAASNSEFDDPPPRKSQQKLSSVKEGPPVKKVNNDLRDRGKPQVTPRNDILREIDALERQSLQDSRLTDRSDNEVAEDDNPTPRGRSRVISARSMSDWDDESDILDDLSDKKGPGIPLMRGTQKNNRDVHSSPSPVQQKEQSGKGIPRHDDVSISEGGGSPVQDKEATPREVKSQVKGQPPTTTKVAVDPLKAEDDVFDDDSDSDWDSEADDILPSDDSAGNIAAGYMPSQLQGSGSAPGRIAASPALGGTRDAKGPIEPAGKEPMGSEESFESTGEEEDLNKSRSSAQKQAEDGTAQAGRKDDLGQSTSPRSPQDERIEPEKDIPVSSKSRSQDSQAADTVLKKQKLKSEFGSIEREKQQMVAAHKKQEELFAERLKEAKRTEEGLKQQQKQEVQELVAEKARLEKEVRRQKEVADETRRQLEEENQRKQEELERKMRDAEHEQKQQQKQGIEELAAEKDRLEEEVRRQKATADETRRELEEEIQKRQEVLERQMRDAEQEKEMELQKVQEEVERVEEEKRKLQEELMAERHHMEGERRKVDEERMIREEEENEAREENRSRDQEELARVQREKDEMEKVLREEREALEMERKRIARDRTEEKRALEVERERLERERSDIERIRDVGEAGLDAEKTRVLEERRVLEEEKKGVAKLDKERQKLEEERARIEEARQESYKIDREKMSLLEEKKNLEDARKEAERIATEKRKFEAEQQRASDEAKKEARKLEAERERLEVEKRKVAIAKQEKEQFENERKNLEEEKKKLESVKRGEMDLVEFERQKLERERKLLEKSGKDREDQIRKEKEDLERSRRKLEEQRMKEAASREEERKKLEWEKQQLEAKKREDDETVKNMILKVEKLSERNAMLEKKAEVNLHAAENGPTVRIQNGHMGTKGMAPPRVSHLGSYDPRTHQESDSFQRYGFTDGTNGDAVRSSRVLPDVSGGDDTVGSEGDSDSPVIERDVAAGTRSSMFAGNSSMKKEAWLPGSLGGGVDSRSRGEQKRMPSLNTNGNGNPSSTTNTFHELLEEYDGLDYSSSSMGEGDEDEGSLANLSPIGAASTPLVTGPLTSTLQIPLNGASTQMQGVVQDLRYRIAREKQSARLAQNKVRQMGEEKEDILHKLDELTKERQHMKNTNLNLEKKLQTSIHEIEGERERRCSAELLLKKTKEQLTKKEKHLTDEHQVREQAELALCKMQVDLKMLQNTVQQLGAEREQLQRQLVDNESSHKYQQKLMETQQMKHDAIYESGSVVLLEAADESRKVAWSQSEKLKEELHTMKVEMERLQFRYKGNEGALSNQIQELESKLDDLRQEQIVNEDALHHASQAFHAQLMAVKIENGQLKASLEQGQHKEQELSKKVDDLQRENERLQRECEDLSKSLQELERATRSEIEKLDGLVNKKQQELNHLRENTKSNEKTIRSMEEKISNLKQQLGIANGALLDRTNQLNTFQREMDKKLLSEQGTDKIIHMEREEKAKAMARADSLSESLRRAEDETSSVRRELDRMRDQTHQREKESETAKEKLNSTISDVQKEKDQVRSVLEEKHANISANLQSLKDSLATSQGDLREKDAEIRSLHQQLTENERKLCLAEANLTVLRKTCDNHERENKDARHELKDLKGKISDLEANKDKLESQLDDVQKSLRDAERRYTESCDELGQAKKSLEHQDVDMRKMHELEREKARLEVAVEQEKDRTHNLKMELDHALQMKNNLEVLLAELKNTNVHIGGKLTLESVAKDMMSQEAEEHKELWESEIKSKSKLGLRLSQLQRSQVNQQGQIGEEKQKTIRALEAKKQLLGKLETERERNHQLEQSNLFLKSKLKLAKRKLKELEVPEAKIKMIQTEFERERFNLEAALATQRKQLGNANEKLEKDLTERQRLEQKNASLQLELASLQSLQKKKKDVSKANKRLEEELADTRRDIQDNYIEKRELEVYKKSLNLKTTHDLNEKLAQINNYFDEQTRARDSMDKTQQSTDAELRTELEASVSNLKSDLAKLQGTHSDLVTKKETLEAELQRYKSLFKKESEKTQRLEEELDQLQRQLMELESKMRFEKQRTSQRTEPPTLDLPPQTYRPTQQLQPNRVDDITLQVREELNRSISRHMEGATMEHDSPFRAPSPVSGGRILTPASPDTAYMSLLKKNYFV